MNASSHPSEPTGHTPVTPTPIPAPLPSGGIEKRPVEAPTGDDCLAAVFENRADAQAAADALLQHGYAPTQVSLVTRGEDAQLEGGEQLRQGDIMENTAATGAAAGATVGLLAGATLLTIPGLGAVVVAGAIASGLTGGIVGGLIGAMGGWGIKKDRLDEYEGLVHAGKSLVFVTGSPPELAQAKSMLQDSPAERVTLHAEAADEGRVDE